MTMTNGVEVLARLDAAVGEGPLYAPGDDVVFCVDIPAGHLWRCTMEGAAEFRPIGEPLGCIAPMTGGGFVLGTRTGVATIDTWDAVPNPWVALEPDRPTQCNDGRCDPQGRFVVGTATADGSVSGALYLVDHDGSVARLVNDVGMSNGIDWSPDGRTAYYVDSIAGTVTSYPWDAERGRLGDGTVIVSIDRRDGLPDGLSVDDEGTLWLAVWGAGEIRHHDAQGRLLEAVTFPTPQISSCAFGGRDRDRLFVTSARAGLDPADAGYADSGAVFVVDLAVTGPAATPFRLAPDAR